MCAAQSVGATEEVTLPGMVIPAAVYDDELVADVAQTIRETYGEESLAKDYGGGEDFHFLVRRKPSVKTAYFGVGVGCELELHDRNMHFDSSYLINGVKVLVGGALKKIG